MNFLYDQLEILGYDETNRPRKGEMYKAVIEYKKTTPKRQRGV